MSSAFGTAGSPRNPGGEGRRILLKIAFLNMWEHRAKTLIVGMLVALGAFTLTAEIPSCDSIRSGQRRTFVESFTGDLIVRAGDRTRTYSLTGSPALGPRAGAAGFSRAPGESRRPRGRGGHPAPGELHGLPVRGRDRGGASRMLLQGVEPGRYSGDVSREPRPGRGELAPGARSLDPGLRGHPERG
ncbi:MAG: hypothetical protein MZU95_15540 [Desulfomicrobium escambiense]|nr:hypothetical protein [Desulfomicrobium escambiense]